MGIGMSIKKVIYPSYINEECWSGLKEGSEVICKKGKTGFITLGSASIDILVENKVYTVEHTLHNISHIKDEFGKYYPIKTENFELNKFDKRKYILQQIIN